MRLRHPIPWLALGLAFLAVSAAARIVDLPKLSLEPARTKRAHLSVEQRARLDAVLGERDHASIEYWVTPRAALPPSLRELEPNLRAAFGALHAAHPDRLHLSVHHPEDSPELDAHRASLGVRAVRTPSILDDRWTESELTSSLRFTLGAHPAALRNGLLTAHAADLPELLITHLEDLANPSKPRVLIDAPEGFVALESLLRERAEVVRTDLSQESTLGPADLLVWVQPDSASPVALAHVEAHIASGGDLLLAGSGTLSALGRDADGGIVQFSPVPAFEHALSVLGAGAREGVLLDPLSEALQLAGGTTQPAHHLLAVPATHQDFRALKGQPNGSLLFDAAAALELDPGRLAAHGFRAEVLATASPRAVTLSPPSEPFSLRQLATLEGSPAARAPVAALLTHEDPLRGRAVLLGSASPLADTHLADERFSHLSLVRVLLDTLTSSDRHLLRQAQAARPPLLPQLSSSQRLRTRLVVIFLIPLLLTAAFFLRRDRAKGSSLAPRLAPLGALIAVPMATSLLLSPLDTIGEDLSADHRHQLDAESAAYFEDSLQRLGGAATLELWRPTRSELPIELAADLDRAAQTLSTLCAATGLDYRELTGDASEASAALGIPPRPLSDPYSEERRAREVCVGARVSTPDGRSVTLDLSDIATHERLRFRLALSLRTLHEGAPPLIAVSSDRPLVSPAEAVLDYQNQGLFAPGGADPYESARAWLSAHGFALADLNPELDAPADASALLLLQPRRDANALYTALFAHLHAGGRALLCAQEHDFLARRLSEDDHAFAYWPRPLYTDLSAAPFSELGLSLDPKLLFDPSHGTALIPARFDQPDQPPHTELSAASEAFCVRVLGADSCGDLVLAGANALKVDEARLEARGLSLKPWLHASVGAWTYEWEGGDLTQSSLSPPLEDPTDSSEPDSPPILAADLEGPLPTCHEDEHGKLAIDEAPTSSPGRLTMIGSSAPFRSAHLHAAGTDHAQLLLHAVARLTLEPELVRMLSQREAPRGFERPSPRSRFIWRLLLIGCALILLDITIIKARSAKRSA